MRKKANKRTEAFELVDHAIRLQLSDDSDPLGVEDCLQKAVALDPDSIEVLQEAAHFYDAVVPHPEKARMFAAQCRQKAIKLVAEMDTIIEDDSGEARQ